ncbi:MAG: pantetheine-phosphate adenylyltransferase [Armatimonadetes bacterium]|nr:pantetheine-phosphate adenylyltransferase [Armatimonadota bacterium]
MSRLAIYPGSFDPPTLGHLDVVARAAHLFDELIVAVGVNSDKAPFLSVEDRLSSLEECVQGMANVRVESFEGLLVDYARRKDCQRIVRGLRAISDFDYEFRVTLANRAMAPEIETVFLITKEEHSFLASSVVREVARLGGRYEGFVPPPVVEKIRKALA